MQRLERSVGTTLLMRGRKGVKLTKAGEKLLLETRQLIAQWEELRERALRSMNEVSGRFTIGVHPSVARYSLPLFLPSLLRLYPTLEIVLQHDLSRGVTQRVLDFELDLGIVVNPVPHPDLVIKKLGQDTVTLWQSKQLKNEDILIAETSLNQTQMLMTKLRRQKMNFKRIIESSNLEVISSMVSSGCGVGILPTRVARAESRDLQPFKGAPQVNDEITLIYRMENKSVSGVATLSQAIQAGFAKI